MIETRVVALQVSPESETACTDLGFRVEIDDEGAGEYVAVRCMTSERTVCIDRDEWPALREAIDKLIGDCRE